MVFKEMKISSYVGVLELSNCQSLIWSGLTGFISLVSSKIANSLINRDFSSIPDKIYELMVKNGVLVKESINEKDILKKIVLTEANCQKGKVAPNLTIYLSRSCNCACVYCYQTNKNLPPFISKEIVLKAVKYAKLVYNQKRILKIHLFGGEPLLNISLLRYVMEEFEGAKKEIGWESILYEITTNGILWSKELSDIFSKDNLQKVQITFDGLQKYHDQLRPSRIRGQSSFNSLWNNIATIKDRTKQLIFRLNVCEENKDDILPLAQQLHNNFGDGIDIYLSHLRASKPLNFTVISPQNYIVILKNFFSWYYSVFKHIHPFLIPNRRYLSCHAAFRIPKWVSTDGQLFQCQHQADLKLPRAPNVRNYIKKTKNLKTVQTFTEFLSLDKILLDKCVECRYFGFCGGVCPGGILAKDIKSPLCETWDMRLRLYTEQFLIK